MSKEEQKEQDNKIAAQTSEQSQNVDTGRVKPLPQSGDASGALAITVRPKSADGKPHKRTPGETTFDLVTYGGLAMGSNEVLSWVITNAVTKKGTTPEKLYGKFEGLFTRFKDVKSVPEYVKGGRLPFLFVATLGGWIPVLPVKWLEDRKGSIVRKLDALFKGKEAVENDPDIKKAHQEIDDAPKQSWGSLWNGRVITVIAAAVADATFGWSKALSTKIFQNTPLNNWSSLDRASTTAARHVVSWFDKEHGANLKGIIKNEPTTMKKISDIAHTLEGDAKKAITPMKDGFLGTSKALHAVEGKHVGGVANAFWLLTLSTSLTVLFYASSKLFANNRENKKQHMEEHKAAGTKHIGLDATQADAITPTDQLDAAADKDKPKTTVAHVKLAEHAAARQEAAPAR